MSRSATRSQIDIDLSIVELLRDERMRDVEAVVFIKECLSLESRSELCCALETWGANNGLAKHDPVIDNEREERRIETQFSGGERHFGEPRF